jgi:MYXO-CTERM domain-containing protein
MKTLMSISLLLFLGPTIAIAQADRQATDNRGDSPSTREDNREHHNYGWIGLLGLAGLAGLRRKSEMHSQLESQGVDVKTVRT